MSFFSCCCCCGCAWRPAKRGGQKCSLKKKIKIKIKYKRPKPRTGMRFQIFYGQKWIYYYYCNSSSGILYYFVGKFCILFSASLDFLLVVFRSRVFLLPLHLFFFRLFFFIYLQRLKTNNKDERKRKIKEKAERKKTQLLNGYKNGEKAKLQD